MTKMTNQISKNIVKYAELAVKVGVNVQKNQFLFIQTTTDGLELARAITKIAYQNGARQVFVDISDDEISRLRYELAPSDSFDYFPEWKSDEKIKLADQGAAFISIVSQSPDLLKGIETSRIAAFQKAAGTALSKYRQYIQSDKVAWTVIAAPSPAWAAKVFPHLPEVDQVPALWDAIFEATRVTTENPVTAWNKHNNTLHTKVDYLNGKKYKALHYTAPGTDLTIELPEKHLWCGAGSTSEQGIEFMANMPTEEVFTLPHRDGVNGYVTNTKPLSYGGNIIDGFKITFKNGRIVEVEAEQGEDVLKHLIATDEGSHYLGEVALVPYDSPISNSGLLFFNTLFDENASNHLAIGSAYAFNIDGGKTMTREQLNAAGANESITHVDFMIGSEKMDIDGILADGTKEPIFRQGNWAF